MLDNTFIEMIKASVDKPLPITVYNYKSMTKRWAKLFSRRKIPENSKRSPLSSCLCL